MMFHRLGRGYTITIVSNPLAYDAIHQPNSLPYLYFIIQHQCELSQIYSKPGSSACIKISKKYCETDIIAMVTGRVL